LSGLFGNSVVGQTIFGIGVLAMALSTISILMLISGFAICEAFEVEHRGWPLRLGILCPAIGVLWPFILTGKSGAYLAVSAAVVGFTLLPMAYVTFFLIMNSQRLLGNNLPRGMRRVVWNTAMALALLVSGGAAVWTAWHKDFRGLPIGRVALIGFAVLVFLGHLYMTRGKGGHRDP
jgi:Mn2+/Fe2+ NRAMP family transporter